MSSAAQLSATVSIEQLQRELAFYKSEYNEVGARLLRAQEEQSRVAREARRSRLVARLIREAYNIVEREVELAQIGQAVLAIVGDTAVCDRAAFLREDASRPGSFVVEHGLGIAAGARISLGTIPEFMFTSGRVDNPAAAPLKEVLGVPFLLWAFSPGSRLGLLIGNRTESNIHRPFEAGDQELVEGALTVYTDVLLLKHAEVSLRQAKSAAEQANTARSHFLATLSHELRTPLNAIMGFSELLLQHGARPAQPGQRDEFVRQILDAGRSLMSLVKDILDFSSLSNAGPRLQLEWVPANQLLHNAVRACAMDETERQIDLQQPDVAPGLEMYIDYDRFRQILANLLGNALKFTPPGGRITVSAQLSAQGEAEIIVRDNGVGIHPADIPRALEPFVQLDNAMARSLPFPGTGLGLPISKQLTEAHRGWLSLDSALGQGTTVMITLPPDSVRIVAEQSHLNRAQLAPAPGGRGRLG
jgi:signal transduction histidine kinase